MKVPIGRLSAFLFSTVIIALAVVSAQSAVLIVSNTNDSGSDSLRATVAAALAGDTIEFNIPTNDPGYNISTGVFTITLTTGEIVIDKDLTVAGPSAANIAVSGNHASRIFNITAGNVAFSDLSLINGKAKGDDGYFVGEPGIGGAILSRASLVCTRCTFRDNSAVGGRGSNGDYYYPPGTGGDAEGGAIANQGTLSLVACTLVGNSATGGEGGIFSYQAHGGRGVGGAIFNDRGSASLLSLANCTVTGNTATFGPNGLFLGTNAQGGGIANLGNLTIDHSTVANNMAVGGTSLEGTGPASSGGGLYCALDSTAALGDVILAGNVAVAGPGDGGIAAGPDVAGAISSQGHNLLGRSDGCTGFTSADLQGGTTDETRLDPMLGPLSYQGGPTQTLPLLPGSPAIDAGNPDNVARDQRYFERTGPPDIGAFEYQGTQPALLANISTRLRVQTGDNAMVGGFIITGTVPKTVIVRGIGPSLPLAGALADPMIEVHGSSGQLLATNDNWREALTRQEIIGSGLPPANDLESALWGTIDPGAYTVVVRGKNDTSGIGLFEVYDLNQIVESKLANVSTRGFVGTDDNVMIGGTIIVGSTPRVLIRAIGPSLTNFGVPNALGDPVLELYGGDGQLITVNHDWRDDQEAEIIATGIPPSNDLESAIVRDLAPGSYTAIVRGRDNTTGVAVIEVYDLN